MPLDVDLTRPIIVLRFTQFVAEFGKLDDVGFGSTGIAGASRAERARKMRERHHMRKFARADLKVRCAFPVAAFHHISRRRSGTGKNAAEGIRTNVHRLDFIGDGTRILVLTELQIGINQIVLPVHLIDRFLVGFCRTHRGHIGGDRIPSNNRHA